MTGHDQQEAPRLRLDAHLSRFVAPQLLASDLHRLMPDQVVINSPALAKDFLRRNRADHGDRAIFSDPTAPAVQPAGLVAGVIEACASLHPSTNLLLYPAPLRGRFLHQLTQDDEPSLRQYVRKRNRDASSSPQPIGNSLSPIWSALHSAEDPTPQSIRLYRRIVRAVARGLSSVVGSTWLLAQQLEPNEIGPEHVKEALRLVPPAWHIRRTIVGGSSIGDATVEPGDTVHINILGMHRSDQYWSDPHSFRPSRWLSAENPPAAFLPFGAGPSRCIAERLVLDASVRLLGEMQEQWSAVRTPRYHLLSLRAEPMLALRGWAIRWTR